MVCGESQLTIRYVYGSQLQVEFGFAECLHYENTGTG